MDASCPKPESSYTLQAESTKPLLALTQDTVRQERQLIIFVNTKRGAESSAEQLTKLFLVTSETQSLAQQALDVLPSPTKQCKRLALCLKHGVAFHHAGLATAQRSLIEDAFRNKKISVIVATPTLAAGVDLPAFRVVIRDLKRYGGIWGMSDIPVLEYHQMAGRAGRPGKDPWGEAICLAKDEAAKDHITKTYLRGEPESILSKLAVEPVLRTYVLSLIATDFVSDEQSIKAFFAKTFYAHQYGDLAKLETIIGKVIYQLKEWNFLRSSEPDGFVSAHELAAGKIFATPLGKRVSELYLDPLTAHQFLVCFERGKTRPFTFFSLLHLFCSSSEMRPHLFVRAHEEELVEEKLVAEESSLLSLPPPRYSDEHPVFLGKMKTAMLFEAWCDEQDEESLLENFGVRPGELHAKLETLEWMARSGQELAAMTVHTTIRVAINKMRLRLKYGVREELLPLLRLRDVGRIRARTMFRAGLRTVAAIKSIDPVTLAQLIGKKTAIKVKEQVGERVVLPIKTQKRKKSGQQSLHSFH